MLTRALEKISVLDHKSQLVRIIIITLIFVYVASGYALVSYYNVQRFSVPNVLLWDIASRWDDAIPLVPAFIWPYQLYIPLMIWPALLVISFRRFIELGAMYCLACSVAWFFHLLLPVRIEHAELLCIGLSCEALSLLRAIDPGVNILPSLHVAHSMLALAFVWRERHPVMPVVLGLALLIVAATVLIKQHYLIDIPAGLLTAAFSWWAVNRISARYMSVVSDVRA